jgi:hypothetical protein
LTIIGGACQAQTTPTAPPPAAPTKPAAPPASLILASSELVVGPNRFLAALLENGRPVANAAVTFEFFQLDGQNATKRGEAAARFEAPAGENRGVYVARTSFERDGAWGVQARAERAGAAPLQVRVNFQVQASGGAPTIGAGAIPSRNATRRDGPDLGALCSAQPPCDMHDLSIADALALRRPLMISFATPGYCTSQMCAPVHGEVQKVKAQRAGAAEFVHVEIYKDPRNLVVADSVSEWRLPSEPWVFVVGKDGQIADRLEGVSVADELDASLSRVL